MRQQGQPLDRRGGPRFEWRGGDIHRELLVDVPGLLRPRKAPYPRLAGYGQL